MRPYAYSVGDGFVLMDGNAHPHCARMVIEYIQDKTVERINWSAFSPDLNPIEHA